jgi:spermidine/putrescine transport system substrate-binding protein
MRKITALVAGCLLAALIAACGSSSGSSNVAPPPKNPNAPVSGTLHVFAYEDTVSDQLMKPFEKQNPNLNVQTATFNSDQADVVESCLDEINPLRQRNLLRPVDQSGIPDWSQLVFTDAKGVTENGNVYVTPGSAGPEGVIYNTQQVSGPITSWKDLFDSKYKGRVALEGDYPLPAMAETALALGIKDPMNMTPDQINQVKSYLEQHRDQFRTLWHSDSELVNLFKSGEVVIGDGGQGVAQRMIKDGIPVKWVPPKEGPISWVCGLSMTSKAQNIAAAYRFINWQASAKAQAIRARDGYVVTNRAAMKLIPPKYQRTADPSILKNAIPETHPPHYSDWTSAFQAFQSG